MDQVMPQIKAIAFVELRLTFLTEGGPDTQAPPLALVLPL